MQPVEVDAIVESLPRGRTLFYYFRDRYALLLLEALAYSTDSVVALKKKLKRSQFAPLLKKPLVKQRLGHCGDGRLELAGLGSYWSDDVMAYRLTLGRWPREKEKWQRNWHQMVRPGQNLVLQLNFSRSHQRCVSRLLDEQDPYQNDSHPVASHPELTLAWARLDVDRTHGEVLIEELQCDWVKEDYDFERCGSGGSRHAQRDLSVVRRHLKMWAEAILAAAIQFASIELGLRRIFLYDFETGNRLKGMAGDYSRPPRSLYTKLPKKFCFRRTAAGPLFLRHERSRWLRRQLTQEETRWWVLELPQPARHTLPSVLRHDVSVPLRGIDTIGGC